MKFTGAGQITDSGARSGGPQGVAVGLQSEDDQLEKMATRIRGRAIRRAGELLGQVEPQSGARTDLVPVAAPSRKQIASEAGMSRDR